MSYSTFVPMTGHCHCGKLSYSIFAEPTAQGICYCRDCQRLSASGFLPWLYVKASAFIINGTPQINHVVGRAAAGTEKVVSSCAECGSSVFGGRYGIDVDHTVYAGTLDDDCVGRYQPSIAMFVKDRPAWAKVELVLNEFPEMPR
jgi:hypothetical protein